MKREIPYKIYLDESELPKYWYNLRAFMQEKPAPLLNPKTLQPMTKEELSKVFCEALAEQELDDTTPFIEIPKEVRDFYKMYRPRIGARYPRCYGRGDQVQGNGREKDDCIRLDGYGVL